MHRPWLENYPPGVPHEVDPTQYSSLSALLEESFVANAGRPFSVCMGQWMSYRQLDEWSAALGAWLQSRGLAPGVLKERSRVGTLASRAQRHRAALSHHRAKTRDGAPAVQ